MARGKTVNRAELARILGVDVRTIDTYTRQGMPIEKRSRRKGDPSEYNTAAAIEWLRESSSEESVPLDFEKARARKMRADAELAEYDLAKTRGELVAVEDVAALVNEDYSAVRLALLGIPARLSAELVIAEDADMVRAILDESIREALAELASRDVDPEELEESTPTTQ